MIVSVYVPLGRELVGTVIIVVPDPTTVTGLNVAVGPGGLDVIVNVTGPLNPPRLVIVIVKFSLLPCFDCPDDVIVKSTTFWISGLEVLPLFSPSPA